MPRYQVKVNGHVYRLKAVDEHDALRVLSSPDAAEVIEAESVTLVGRGRPPSGMIDLDKLDS